MGNIGIEKEQDKDLGCNLCKEGKDIYCVTFRLFGGMGHVIRLCQNHLTLLEEEIQQNK